MTESSATAQLYPKPGEVVEEKYEIQRVLGASDTATVYAALQRHPRRTVAVKLMRGAGADPVSHRRVRREIEGLGRLRHPYIAQILEAGPCDDLQGGSDPYVVVEYVPGGFLSVARLDFMREGRSGTYFAIQDRKVGEIVKGLN